MTEEVIQESPKVDFYLRLNAESDMPTVLSDFYGVNDDGDSILVTHTQDYAIDVVGTLYEPTGVTLTDAEGIEYAEMTALSGWHVNIRLAGDAKRTEVEALDTSHGVTPVSPQRVWL